MLSASELHDSAAQATARSIALRSRSAELLLLADATIRSLSDGESGVRIKPLLEEIAGLRRAMESRAVIEQAKGIIIARVGCSADAAFTMLVQQSQHENRKVRDVAEGLVRTAIRSDQRPSRTAVSRLIGQDR